MWYDDLDQEYYYNAAIRAAINSPDLNRKVGSILVDSSGKIRISAYNDLPAGVKKSPARLQREGGEKYFWTEHAERNMIYTAARLGIPTQGCATFTTLFPCDECARGIIQSGLVALFTFAIENEPRFLGAMNRASQMLLEAGVKVFTREHPHPSIFKA